MRKVVKDNVTQHKSQVWWITDI